MKSSLIPSVSTMLMILAVALSQASCGRDGSRTIDTSRIEPDARHGEETGETVLRIAVGSVVTPKRGFTYYKQLVGYIGEQLGQKARSLDTKTYSELNKLFRDGGADLAFVCSMPYVYGKRHAGMELLVAPQVRGELVYHAYVIVPTDSKAKSLQDLKGGTFAFCDPLSNTGTLVPTYMLQKLGETPDSFFRKYTYTYAHDKTIKVVGQKVVDGGAVHSLVWEYEKRSGTGDAGRTRVLEKSEPYAIPPVVVREDLDPQLKTRLKDILLKAHEDDKGRKILEGMMIERFVHIEDSAYDSIREMEKALAKQKAPTK